MCRLLRANLARLIRDKVFIACVATMVLFGMYWVLRESINRCVESTDPLLFYHSLVLPFALACACALFIGTEYSDGTLRNKISVGHARKDIYMANLITCATAGGIMQCASIITVAISGIWLNGFIQGATFRFLLLSVLNMLAIASVCTLLGMCIQSKSSSAVVALIGLVAMFGLAVALNMRLEKPMFLPDAKPNPAYMAGMPRQISEFLFDLLPAGQSINLFQMKATDPIRMALCSTGVIVLSTLSGVLTFCRRDVK